MSAVGDKVLYDDHLVSVVEYDGSGFAARMVRITDPVGGSCAMARDLFDAMIADLTAGRAATEPSA